MKVLSPSELETDSSCPLLIDSLRGNNMTEQSVLEHDEEVQMFLVPKYNRINSVYRVLELIFRRSALFLLRQITITMMRSLMDTKSTKNFFRTILGTF